MNKKLIIMGLMMVLLSSFVVAGTFRIQSPVGTDQFTVDTSGNVNASGTIAESGLLLSDVYCALGGCTMTGTISSENVTVTGILNATGATLDFDADSIEEADISFGTTCASGSRLYVDSGNLACEIASVADVWVNSSGDSMTGNLAMGSNNITGVDYVTANFFIGDGSLLTGFNATDTKYFSSYNVVVVDNGAVTYNGSIGNSSAEIWAVIANGSYQAEISANCGAGQQVLGVLDNGTLACVADADSDPADVWINVTGDTMSGNLAMGSNNITGVDYIVANFFSGDGSGLTGVPGTADVYVNTTGDTMTGGLVMDNKSIDLQYNTTLGDSGAYLTNTLGDVVIVIQ